MKIPNDAFQYYVSLAAERSYRAVAEHFGVSKRAVTKHAVTERWAERLEEIEREAREKGDRELAETLQEMQRRHMKILRAMSARALTALKEFPLTSGMDAIRAAEVTMKLERLIAGEPSSRAAITVEEVTRREMEMLLVGDDEEEEEDHAGESEPEVQAR
jgi:hypothetical protein